MSDLVQDSINKKNRLGRGLGSLLGEQRPILPESKVATSLATTDIAPPASSVPAEARVWNVAIDKLQPGVYQPRQEFDKEKIDELANSIKQSGIVQPLIARKLSNSKYEIIAGERRWRAAQQAGLHEVPVVLKSLTNKEALEISLVENIQREDLNPIEEATAYNRLAQEFGLTQQEVAERVGKERATVANSIRLLNLPLKVRELLLKNEISVGHAKLLLSISDQAQASSLAQVVASKKLTVKQLEKLIKSRPTTEQAELVDGAPTAEGALKIRLVSGIAEELQKLLGTKVNIDYNQAKGKISIHFYSDDELSGLVEKLKRGCQKF